MAGLLRHYIVILALLAFGFPGSAGAQSPRGCSFLCAPALTLAPGIITSHLFAHPRVQSVADGRVTTLPSRTNVEVILDLGVPTAVPRLSLFTSIQWLPTAGAPANPFTEYSASQLGTSDIRANLPSVTLGARYTAVKPSQTGGWVSLTPYVGDLFSRASRPDSRSDYTHKLDLGLIGTLSPFAAVPSQQWLKHLQLYLTLDWVATGVPRAGDEIPKGERVFLSDADATSLIVGLSAPLAPWSPSS